MLRLAARLFWAIAGVAAITWTGYRLVPINSTTAGFAYLLFVLVIASTWGFREAAAASLVATLTLNFFFLPPFGTLSVADPLNWVALFSFLATALIAGRLSHKAERRAQDAIERRQDVEHLYAFSRAILLIDDSEPFARQLAQKVADIFPVNAVVLFERATGRFFRTGADEFDGLDDQLREAASQGSAFFDPQRHRVITAVRLGTEPIAALAMEGARMPDSVLQGIANLVAIGLERARAQDLAHQVEAARRSDQLRSTLLDAMAHEFKTPLTSIKAATTALLGDPAQPAGARTELLTIADEEADHLKNLIEDSVEMARLDNAEIDLHREAADATALVRETLAAMKKEIEGRVAEVAVAADIPAVPLDRRLIGLALRQLLDNALKYSAPRSAIEVAVKAAGGSVIIEISNGGDGIPPGEQTRIFERFYRGEAARQRIPGSGLGLAIAATVVKAHHGDLTLESRPGRTTFRMRLPVDGGRA